jgi:glycine/D-amino acid oxidase-like deaminating enzyme
MTVRAAAVLGAGIMGASTALRLARAGVDVTLFDSAPEPFSGASRWNEGKIHLGFLYAADPTLNTARAVVPGGLDFRDQVEQLTGVSLANATTGVDDVYLVHRDSVVDAQEVGAYFDAVADLVAGSPDARRYLVDVSKRRVRRLDDVELADVAPSDVVTAGFRVPERSVDTNVVADAFVAALDAQPRLTLALDQHVRSVQPAEAGATTRWFVRTADGRDGPFDAVVNALWQGRPAVDESVGHHPDTAHQHRFRVSLFVHTHDVLDTPCAVLSVGPFGDVKNYDGRNFYLSWYPLGLLARAESVVAPATPALDDAVRTQLADDVFAALAQRLPWVERIQQAASAVRVEGGWVYSQGRGLLDDPKATVHQRDRLGITNVGTYYSVDTGKYSVAPTLADHLTRAMMGGP